MDLDENALLSKLRSTFRSEAPGKIRIIRRALFEASRNSSKQNRPDVLREIHNLKGISRIASLPEIQMLCEKIERLLKNLDYPTPPTAYQAIMESLELIEELSPFDEPNDQRAATMCARLDDLLCLSRVE
jgi:HPt (histidine-containing phosphotransfer) domain-containing protein